MSLPLLCCNFMFTDNTVKWLRCYSNRVSIWNFQSRRQRPSHVTHTDHNAHTSTHHPPPPHTNNSHESTNTTPNHTHTCMHTSMHAHTHTQMHALHSLSHPQHTLTNPHPAPPPVHNQNATNTQPPYSTSADKEPTLTADLTVAVRTVLCNWYITVIVIIMYIYVYVHLSSHSRQYWFHDSHQHRYQSRLELHHHAEEQRVRYCYMDARITKTGTQSDHVKT